MSRGAKKRNQDKRRREKERRKAANRARYASYIGTEANKKKKGRALAEGAKEKHKHVLGFCGNSACSRCTGQSAANNPFMASTYSYLYSKRWTSKRWKKQWNPFPSRAE